MSTPDQRTRRFRQRGIGDADLAGVTKTLLFAIAYRMGACGEPCTAGYPTLARDTSLGLATVYHHAKIAARAGALDRSREPGARAPSLTVLAEPRQEEKRRKTSPEVQREQSLDHPARYPLESFRYGWQRWLWEREIRGSDLPAPGKGIAWSISLIWNSEGIPRYRVTFDDLARLSGYERQTVKQWVRKLEEEGWIEVYRRPGWRGGMDLLLRFPDPVLTRLLEVGEERGMSEKRNGV